MHLYIQVYDLKIELFITQLAANRCDVIDFLHFIKTASQEWELAPTTKAHDKTEKIDRRSAGCCRVAGIFWHVWSRFTVAFSTCELVGLRTVRCSGRLLYSGGDLYIALKRSYPLHVKKHWAAISTIFVKIHRISAVVTFFVLSLKLNILQNSMPQMNHIICLVLGWVHLG